MPRPVLSLENFVMNSSSGIFQRSQLFSVKSEGLTLTVFLVKPFPFRGLRKIAPVTAPGILAYLCNQPCSERIAVNIPYQFKKITISIHQDRLIAASEQSPVAFIAHIVALGIHR
jgi:hypothetical protein